MIDNTFFWNFFFPVCWIVFHSSIRNINSQWELSTALHVNGHLFLPYFRAALVLGSTTGNFLYFVRILSMLRVLLIQFIRHHLNHQAGWQGTQSLMEKKKKKVIPNVPRHKSFALMLCGKPLTIQFQTQTPTIYTVPELPPSPGDFTFIRPHTSIKGRVEGVCSSYDVTTPRRNRKKRGWRVQRESGGSEWE